jgi:NAD+ synthase (glutamine-hydrolysing)
LKIALAQMNSIVGDIDGNVEKIKNYLQQARESNAQIVVFPELAVTGYPPQDLLYENEFIRANKSALKELSRYSDGIVVIVGFVDFDKKWKLYNCAAVISDRKILAVVKKTLLPTYDVFDEERYFEPGRPEEIAPRQIMIEGQNISLGVEICEDLWDGEYDNCRRGYAKRCY